MNYLHIPFGFQLPDFINYPLMSVTYQIYLLTGLVMTPEVVITAVISATGLALFSAS